MGHLLNQGASGTCSHGGNATPIVGNPRVKVRGVSVLTVMSQLSHAGCPNNPSGVSPLPCTIAMYTTGASRVKVMNAAMLLDSSTPTNVPTGASTTITQTQTGVKGQ
jgi:hypothetical protein